MVREKCPDLVILDLKMPGMGGMEFLARAKEACPDTVIVVITGYATLESAVEAMKKGAYDFLPKPFTPDELKLVVGRGIERRQLILKTVALEREKQMLRDSFAAVVSHQLRSPLVGAMQYMELVEFRYAEALPEAVKPIFEKVCGKMRQLLDVIEKWQRFFKTDTVLKPEEMVSVDLSEILRGAWETVRIKTASQMKFELYANGATGRVRGNAGMLEELFANLFSNAIKYSSERGEVTVRVKEEKPWVIVDVSDKGVGIPEEDLPRVFDCFYRGSGEAARMSAGLGLGLALVKRIAGAHGGSISVRSKLGEGSTFTVKIPLGEGGGEKPS
jgi:signal transduction histidine kinase